MKHFVKPAISIVISGAIVLSAIAAFGQVSNQPVFAPVKQWEKAMRSGNTAALKTVYSVNPPAQFIGKDKKPLEFAQELAFWQSFHASSHPDLKLIQCDSGDQQGMHVVSLTLSFHVRTPQGLRTRYILVDQGWQQQAGTWRIMVAKHTGIVTMPQPTQLNTNIYPDVDAKAEIRDAISRASREHKRIILVFGANWCYDCHVLDYALQQPSLAKLVQPSFIVVHVDTGESNKNMDLVSRYKIPLDRGIPALAVLDSDGSLLYSQQNGEFEAARSMDPATLTAFLKQWKP